MAVPLSPEQVEVLRRYLEFDVSLEEVRLKLRGVLEFDLKLRDGERWMDCNFPPPEPGIRVTREHLESALQRRRDRCISEQQLVEWATMLLMNHAYDCEGDDEDLIAEWLNDISFNLNPHE